MRRTIRVTEGQIAAWLAGAGFVAWVIGCWIEAGL